MDPIRPTNDNFFIRHATNVAIGTVTLLMLLAGVMFWRQSKASEEAKRWVSHTYEVIGHIRIAVRQAQGCRDRTARIHRHRQ